MSLQLPYVPVLEKCFGYSLKTGSLILGWLAMISSSCKIILVIIIYFNLQHHFLDNFEEAGIIRDMNWFISNPRFSSASLSIAGFLCTVDFIFTVFLVKGLHNEEPSEMQPYLLCSIFSLVLTLLVNMVMGVYFAVYTFYWGLTFVTIAFLTIVLFQYLWSVLYSYYRELEDKQSGSLKYKQFNDDNIAL